jgi:hypothetical protein
MLLKSLAKIPYLKPSLAALMRQLHFLSGIRISQLERPQLSIILILPRLTSVLQIPQRRLGRTTPSLREDQCTLILSTLSYGPGIN